MNIFTHIGISRGIIAAIEKNLGISLDKAGFMFGNIKPDINLRLSSVPHLKNSAMDFVCAEIKKLLSMEFKIEERCSRQFSERLGVITHYLSDFFCYAHQEYFSGSLMKHCIYENNLSRYCRKSKAVAADRIIEGITIISADLDSIQKFIENMHSEYLKDGNRPSFKRDMKYALDIVVSFCTSIVMSRIVNEISTAA